MQGALSKQARGLQLFGRGGVLLSSMEDAGPLRFGAYHKKERATMSEEEVPGGEQAAEASEPKATTVTEEIKVQAQDLVQTISNIIKEGTATRVLVVRNNRTLIDIPMAVGIGASVVLAIYLPVISAIAGIGALLSGCTVRIEREEPPAQA
jgi:hypothetical protein